MCNAGLRNDADYSVAGILADDRNPGRVYMGSGSGSWVHNAWQKRPFGGGVWRSDDKGEHWRLLTRDVTFSGEGTGKHSGNVLEFDPTNHDVIYAAGFVEGLWVTRDAGANWSRLGFEGKCLTGVWVDPDDSQRLLVGARPDVLGKNQEPGGLFESLDDGKTWAGILDVPNAHDLARHPVQHDWLVVSTGGLDTYLSQDRGKTWRKLKLHEQCSRVYRARWQPGQPQRLWTVGGDNGIFYSDDLGETWVWPTQDPKKTFRYPPVEVAYMADRPHQAWTVSNALADLLIDPVRPERMYNCCFYTVSASTDGGMTWEMQPQGLSLLCVYDVVPDPVDPNVVYVLNLDHGLLKSTDGGKHFRWPIAEGEFSVNETAQLWISPKDNKHLALTVTYDWKNPHWTRVGVSRDGGVTWKSLGKGLPLDSAANAWLTGLVALDDEGRELMVAYDGNPEERGIYSSRDGGETWTLDREGLPQTDGLLFGSGVTALPHLVTVGDCIYAGTSGDGVYRRLKAEKTWTRIGEDVLPATFKTLAICPQRPDSVWVGTQAGLFVSDDRGESFQRVGLEKMQRCFGVAIDPFNPDRWFVAVPDPWWTTPETNEPGIYVTTDNGKTFARLTDMPCVGKAWRVVCDPHREGVIYIACMGIGSWRGEVRPR